MGSSVGARSATGLCQKPPKPAVQCSAPLSRTMCFPGLRCGGLDMCYSPDMWASNWSVL